METIKDLIGVVMVSVENDGNEELVFTAEDGRKWKFYHEQDCCESVLIDDIIGELSDLVGSPICMAEEIDDGNDESKKDEYDTSYTWTFYKFATIKGYVTVRWYGTSNGYYSESVDFVEIRTK